MVIRAPWRLKAVLKDTSARLMEVADAFGLGLFAFAGANIEMAAGMSASVSVLLDATTAIVAALARDVLRNEVPKVYQRHQPCAWGAVAGSLSFIGLAALGVAPEPGSLVGIGVATGSRFLAIAWVRRFPAGACRRDGNRLCGCTGLPQRIFSSVMFCAMPARWLGWPGASEGLASLIVQRECRRVLADTDRAQVLRKSEVALEGSAHKPFAWKSYSGLKPFFVDSAPSLVAGWDGNALV